ncbi:tetratricopeptide repeat protein [Gallaecimonas mangrovi]|uniref:tetratricopeptide repeat protein n=1 Tax=Gallaecimonas mangrovi TaxID=2291597 RepID=UPI000E207FB2|nr:tetratricopeptide repeat protein [Gallaecimonas mangrovi]
MKTLIVAALAMVSSQLLAAPLIHYQQSWAEIKYQTADKEQEKNFAKLRLQMQSELKTHGQDPDYLIWGGIISASYAGAKGGLGALKYVKEARSELEKAIKINDKALGGSAYTSLGSLYYLVPGWPISFGDDDKAKQYLQKALVINPDGIDANFFYGDFLMDQGHYRQAKVYLEKALAAPARPGRAVADAGRKGEIQERLKTIQTKL